MSTLEKTEKVDIVYDGSKIVIRGRSFEVSAQIGATELASIYMSGKGEAQATISVDVPDIPKWDATEVTPPKRRKKTKTLAEVQSEQSEFKFDPNG